MYARKTVAKRLLVANQALPNGLQLLIAELTARFLSNEHLSYVTSLRCAAPIPELAMMTYKTSRAAMLRHRMSPVILRVRPSTTLQQIGGGHVEMGSVLNTMDTESSSACYTACSFIPQAATANRTILANAMEIEGFVNYPSEWWHWSYDDRYWAAVTQQPQAVYGPVEEDAVA